ncbi:hypothetical protein PIB30_077231, partial [Stylosanthes scabra]|nr:hypothetical protein [Stylosanthes scabra]
MDVFLVPVFYHGGRLEVMANGQRCYAGGEVEKFPPMDVDFVNKEDLLVLVRELGYLEHMQLFWHDPTEINFEDGLHVLESDMDINNMCDCCLNNNLKEFHIYVDHVVNVPVPAVISSSSSSSSSSSDD